MAKGASAVGKRSPRPRRAGGKTPPISPWAAYRATSTNSESPHWRRGIVLLQDPFELFGMPLQIVKTVPGRDDSWPATLLPPDHYGCGLGCARFTGTLAAVEEHERGCLHFLEPLLPEGLDRDICNGDEDEHALNLRDIVEPLQQPLSVLQKERRVKLASLSLVVSDKMLQLESTDRHPATSQKLPMSTQSTLPAAPASAPLLPSASIVPIPLSLNLLHKTPLHSTQTGDSNLVANTTVDSSHEEKVPRQQGLFLFCPCLSMAVANLCSRRK